MSTRWLTKENARWISAGYILAWIGYGAVVLIIPWRPDGAAQFGDAYGAFNAFVSGLAMLGVIAAILLQRQQIQMQAEELRLQRIELKLTRRELKRTAEAQEESARIMNQQFLLTAKAMQDEAQHRRLAAGANLVRPAASATRDWLDLKVTNFGGPMRRVRTFGHGYERLHVTPELLVRTDDELAFRIRHEPRPEQFECGISYLDQHNEERALRISYELNSGALEVAEVSPPGVPSLF